MGGDDSDVLVLAVSEKALVQGAVPSSGEGGRSTVSGLLAGVVGLVRE